MPTDAIEQLTERSLTAVNPTTAKSSIDDLELFGHPDAWECLCKASSRKQGFMKTTKAMQWHDGALIQTETQQRNPDGSWSLSQALAFVPNARARLAKHSI